MRDISFGLKHLGLIKLIFAGCSCSLDATIDLSAAAIGGGFAEPALRLLEICFCCPATLKDACVDEDAKDVRDR